MSKQTQQELRDISEYSERIVRESKERMENNAPGYGYRALSDAEKDSMRVLGITPISRDKARTHRENANRNFDNDMEKDKPFSINEAAKKIYEQEGHVRPLIAIVAEIKANPEKYKNKELEEEK